MDLVTNGWTILIYTGDEHHDGAQVVDIDNDGDYDLISIGWGHDQVVLYENLSNNPSTPKTYSPTAATETPSGLLATPNTPPPYSFGTQVEGLQVLYQFDESGGELIHDVAGIGEPLDLQISDPSAVQWLPDGGLELTRRRS